MTAARVTRAILIASSVCSLRCGDVAAPPPQRVQLDLQLDRLPTASPPPVQISATATNVSAAPIAIACGFRFQVRGPDGISSYDNGGIGPPVVCGYPGPTTPPGGGRTASWQFLGNWFDANGEPAPAPPGTYVVLATVSEAYGGVVAQKTITFVWP